MNNDNISFMKWGAITRHHPSVFLLAAQLMSLALYVAFESVPSGQFLLGAFVMMILLLVVWVIIRSPAVNWVARIIAGLAVLLSISKPKQASHILEYDEASGPEYHKGLSGQSQRIGSHPLDGHFAW